jgi:hypothetical protein
VKDSERDPGAVLSEVAPLLSLLATRALYEEQPELWTLGERGRSRTVEDFHHHFLALQSLEVSVFRNHVQYCETLFAARGFPRKWLGDAWRWMAIIIERELPKVVAHAALATLDEAIRSSKTTTH